MATTTRTRSRSVFEDAGISRYESPSRSSSDSLIFLKEEEMSDVEIPNFYQKKKSGILPVNPMTQTKTVLSSPPMDFEFFRTSDPSDRYRCQGLVTSYSPITVSNGSHCYLGSYAWTSAPETPSWPSRDVLIQEANANARAAGFDILTFMAEWNKTLDLVLGFQERVIRRAERIKRKRSVRTEREFLDAWMEYRYGWRILMYDIESISESFDRLKNGFNRTRWTAHDERFSRSSSSYVKGNASYVHGAGEVDSLTYMMRASITAGLEHRRSMRAGVGVEMAMDDILTIDPLTTAWEVIPFSFVADWFVNLGDLIASYSPFANGKFLWGFVTEEESMVYTTDVLLESTYPDPPNHFTVTKGYGQMAARRTTKVRYPYEPSPSLRFRVNLSHPKIVDLFAILWGLKDGTLARRRKSLRV